MKRIFLIITLILIIFSITTNTYAQEERFITLKDGSSIKGQIISFKNNIYTIKTETLGEVNIEDSNIVSISTRPLNTATQATFDQNAGTNLGGNSNLQSQVQELQGSIMSDPSAMMEMQKLLEDPEIMSVLSDQSLINDIMSYDQNKIQNNPKIQKLMENPQMKAFIEKMSQQHQITK